MFTGLIQAVGRVVRAVPRGSELDLDVDLSGVGRPQAVDGFSGGAAEAVAGVQRGPAIGDSIALSGVCCTVVELSRANARFRLSEETLRRTWLGRAGAETPLNLEAALRAGDPLGGHLVQGHVDGVGEVVAAVDADAGGTWRVRVPPELARYCVEKGSIALDGISLTIAEMTDRSDGVEVGIAVIPHTAQVTTLGASRPGDPVHVEVDVLAKYVERMLAGRT